MSNIPGQIISELGEIGKKVGGEVAKIPKDIAGKAMESLGASSGQKQGGQTIAPKASPEGTKAQTAWEQIDGETDEAVKRKIARKALEALLARPAQQKEPSIWERLQMEQEQKKETAQKQQIAASQNLPLPTSKRARGDLYGAKAKQTAAEKKAARQD